MVDKELTKIIKDWKDEAGLAESDIIMIAARAKKESGTLKLYLNKPGVLAGAHGELVNKYTNIIREKFPDVIRVHFVRTEAWYIK